MSVTRPVCGGIVGSECGGCSGNGTCTVTIDGSKTVTARFTLKTYALNVTTSGMGTVTSNPAGIACGQTCSATYNHDTR